MRNDHAIGTLNGLIRVSRDGQEGFRVCAEHARSEHLKQIYMDRSRECADAVAELQSLVRQLGGDPDTDGSAVGAMHQGWVGLRSALSRDDDAAVLAECERGEDVALEAYRNALDKPMPDFVRRVVLRQFEGVMSNHDQIRSLRNRYQHRGQPGMGKEAR